MKTCKCCSCKNKECSVAQCKEECTSIREAERKEFCSCGYIHMCSNYKKKEDFTDWLINREDSIK